MGGVYVLQREPNANAAAHLNSEQQTERSVVVMRWDLCHCAAAAGGQEAHSV